ncbi:MAG: COG1361 S-layer family protein [Methermicoccaceae archaeon]
MNFKILFTLTLLFILLCPPSSAAVQGTPHPLEHFANDFYKVKGSPDISVSLERSSIYQGEKTSLFLSVMNRGRITSIEVNREPTTTKNEEVYAASRELEMERERTVAQDISIRLFASNGSVLDIKREVAYAGSLREGQVSSRLEFPVEVYENTPPGSYTLYAIVNYTYQRDVAAEEDADRPQNPDIYYWYESVSQTIPLTIEVQRESKVKFEVVSVSPEHLEVGSSDNVVNVLIENVGNDTARDVIVRLRPESGVYVDVDESPISVLAPHERAELKYRLDVSKDALAGRLYSLTLLFEYSDTYRDGLEDSEHVYVILEPASNRYLQWGLFVVSLGGVFIALLWRYQRRGGVQ